MLLFVCTETTESKPVEQETSHTMLLLQMVSVLWPDNERLGFTWQLLPEKE